MFGIQEGVDVWIKPLIDPIFTNTKSTSYWTSTEYTVALGQVWWGSFYGGSAGTKERVLIVDKML